jgi:DmsE family decaheme c-type cytochrome
VHRSPAASRPSSLLAAFLLPWVLVWPWRASEPPAKSAKAKPPAGATTQPEPKVEYASPDACALCHKDVADAAAKRVHGAILERRAAEAKGHNCQTCHGPSQAHVENPIEVKTAWTPANLGRNTSAKMCLNCHSNQIQAIVWRRGDHHSANVQCWECHSTARPAKAHSEYVARPGSTVCLECHPEVEGLFRLNSHHPVVLATETERVACSDCHAVHGRRGERDWAATCKGCHAQHRGPYRFEHGVLSGRLSSGCLECHSPHGSPNPRLLRFNDRGLCLQCHGDKVTHFPGLVCWTCHTEVHGSNSSPLFFTP